MPTVVNRQTLRMRVMRVAGLTVRLSRAAGLTVFPCALYVPKSGVSGVFGVLAAT